MWYLYVYSLYQRNVRWLAFCWMLARGKSLYDVWTFWWIGSKTWLGWWWCDAMTSDNAALFWRWFGAFMETTGDANSGLSLPWANNRSYSCCFCTSSVVLNITLPWAEGWTMGGCWPLKVDTTFNCVVCPQNQMIRSKMNTCHYVRTLRLLVQVLVLCNFTGSQSEYAAFERSWNAVLEYVRYRLQEKEVYTVSTTCCHIYYILYLQEKKWIKYCIVHTSTL